MELKSFDKVLARDNDNEKWDIDIFKKYNEGKEYPYECISYSYSQCIPYEGNEFLFNTVTASKHRYEFKDGDTVIVWNNSNPDNKYIAVFKCKEEKHYITYSQINTTYAWNNCIPFNVEDKE